MTEQRGTIEDIHKAIRDQEKLIDRYSDGWPDYGPIGMRREKLASKLEGLKLAERLLVSGYGGARREEGF